MKNLPIAKTELRQIVEENFCYVDKTKYIEQLVNDKHGYYFLSRPRRFGKSLFVDTLRAAFAGEKELFKGLYLEDNWDWDIKYPVINISLGSGTGSSIRELNSSINFSLKIIAKKYNVTINEKEIAERLKELIINLFEKYNKPVVVLVDEYDKPILDNLTKPVVEEIREKLSNFYSVLKDTSEYLKFVFLTGVSKFSKTSIFSKLNNITDISLVPKYADICGYTQHDLETVFEDYLHGHNMQKVKDWYDGYNFRGQNLYNPYDVLMFLWEKEYKAFWFGTGTPKFLLDLIKKRKFYIPDLENIEIEASQMEEFDIKNIELDVLLFQTGYLTIKERIDFGQSYLYRLKIPNFEVGMGINDYMLRMFYAAGANSYERTELSKKIYFSLFNNKPKNLEQAFKSFFSKIPVDWYRKNDIAKFEGFYSSMFYAFFAALGLDMVAEDTTNKGRIDLTVKMDIAVYIFEFKMKTQAKNALEQIKEKKYHEKYLSEEKEIYLIGIEFDEKEKNIS
ncbi:MAG: ATP-binding protein, partial [Bacteroidota bacterium]